MEASNDFESAIVRLKNGDKDAFSDIIDAFQDRIRSLVALRGVTPSEVDSVAQEVFIYVYQHIHDYRAESLFKSWIQSIARFKVLQWHEERSRLQKNKDKLLEVYLSQEFQRINREFSDQAEQDILDKLQQCFNHLSHDLQDMLKKKYSGWSIKAIADETGKGESSIKMSLMRARINLKDCILGL